MPLAWGHFGLTFFILGRDYSSSTGDYPRRWFVMASAKSAQLSYFLTAVSEQKSGFRFGDPERVQDCGLAAVVPILRETSLRRQYITFPEASSGEVRVLDTGRIDRFSMRNDMRENVFVRSGTIFQGNTQERCLVRSVVLFGGRTADVEVRCVHASRGIRPGAETTYGGISPLEVDRQVYTSGYKPVDQSSYWSSVQSYTKSMAMAPQQEVRRPWSGPVSDSIEDLSMPSGAMGMSSGGAYSGSGHVSGAGFYTGAPQVSPSVYHTVGAQPVSRSFNMVKADDLHTAIQSFSTDIDDILKRVERKPNQVGLGVITDKGCQTIELFDVPLSWEALHTDAVKRVGQDLSRTGSDVFDYKPQYALNTLAAVLSDSYEENSILDHRPSNGEPPVKIFGLTNDRFLGEVVEVEGRVIHLVLNRKAS
jgi:hypothetical protein